MSKKIVKKTKIKFASLLVVLLIILGLFFGVYFLLQVKTKNIIIRGNEYLNDDYIIDLAGIGKYPGFISFNSLRAEKKVKKSKYISSCDIKKKWGFILEVNINENKALFYDTNKNKYILETNEIVDDEEISHEFRVPRLLNYVPDKKYNKFVKKMSNVKDDILSRISDIEYQPNDYDKDRFLLYMDDGNMVYLTLTKFNTINHYNEVLTQLEGRKGILYLDNGNHFQIMQ